MHIIDRLFDKDAAKTESVVVDYRDHVSMSLQIYGLKNGTTATLYGTLFEKNFNFIPVTINGSTTISSDGMYVVPPYFRFYKLRLNRAGASTVTAYFYACKEGAFLQNDTTDAGATIANGALDLIRLGAQSYLEADATLTPVMTTLDTVTFAAGSSVYLSNIFYNVSGQGGAHIEIEKLVGDSVTPLYKIDSADRSNLPVYLLDKIQDSADLVGCSVRLKAKKYIPQFESNLFSKLIFLRV